MGDLIAAVSGLVLFISLFLNWYKVSVKAVLGSASASVSGWEALSFIDILLFIIAAIVIGVAVAQMANATPRLPISTGLLVLGLGVLATLLVLYRIIDIPGSGDVADVPGVDLGRSYGIFIALIASLGITAGGWITWNEEGKPKPGAVGAGTGAPVGTGAGPAAGGYQQQAAAPAATPAATPAPGAGAAPAAATPPAATGGADAPPPNTAADWYPDPRGEKRLRYWDGSQWTHHTAD